MNNFIIDRSNRDCSSGTGENSLQTLVYHRAAEYILLAIHLTPSVRDARFTNRKIGLETPKFEKIIKCWNEFAVR